MAPPLNPFLRAFFRSAYPSQCAPIGLHVLLVPTTEILLSSRDRETNTPYHLLCESEEFIGSHVLRVPTTQIPGGPNNPSGPNARESKSKAKQFSTINGRTVVVKESWVYANKGFKSLNQAQLLGDAIYYPDVGDGQQWLVYWISRPLIGSFQLTPVLPAVLSDEPSKERRKALAEAAGSSSGAVSTPGFPRKKEIKNFAELLSQFPMISRQMTPGLERTIREFTTAHSAPLPKRSSGSRRSSISSQRSTPSISDSLKSSISGNSTSSSTVHPTSLELDPSEEALRTGLETAVTTAIDLFQAVDKHQLSLLGASTELTGPVVERMIEKYITEQVHDTVLFPRVCTTRKPEDAELESKVRRMVDVDVSQVGLPLEGGMREKRVLNAKLGKGVEVFRRMGVASSPQEMLEILLGTQKAITAPDAAVDDENDSLEERERKLKGLGAMTINADVLVSMLLVVVIRSGVRHLNARLLYMRYFIFIDEVELGEQGYALATLEAVVMHLSEAAGGLRKASRRNRAVWGAARAGDLQALEAILTPEYLKAEPAIADLGSEVEESSEDEEATLAGQPSRKPSEEVLGNFAAVGGSLEHVFPFQKPPTPPPEQLEVQTKAKKRVSMAAVERSQSTSSAFSSRSHSRTKSTDSAMTASGAGDLSAERLSQTQDSEGNSVLMMAVESGKLDALKFLLGLPAHFRADFILDDMNADGTTLLSEAVQSGNREVTDELIFFLESNASAEELQRYLALQDSRGRCIAHYLFNQPHLLQKFGKKLPWRLKDKNGQTPLFALCRSYDHSQYHEMVSTAFSSAQQAQQDDQPLHLDDHVDAKGNTLLHIVNDTALTLRLLRHCDSDVNAGNDKRFTPIMVSSKYGRIDHVRTLFSDPRVDMTLRDARGLSAVELAKDDDVRNRIDDMVLLSHPPDPQTSRTTTIVRSFFVEDATTRFVLKSAAPTSTNANTITVSTSRRSLSDFENLARWLSLECPASWLPTHFNLPSPFLLPSKPSRAVLRDTQLRLDNFFHSLLSHATFSTHELVWEFFLVPDMSPALLDERSKLKALARVEKVREEFEPIAVHETQEVENFVAFAREQVRAVTTSTKKSVRCVNAVRMAYNDFAEASALMSKAWGTLLFLPQGHSRALDRYGRALAPSDASPLAAFYYSLHSTVSTSSAVQVALNRPAYLIASMASTHAALLNTLQGLQRSNRWTPGFFEGAKESNREEAERKLQKGRAEVGQLGRELRYTQQTVAGELAGWWEGHAGEGRRAVREFAKKSLVRERSRLEGLRRVLGEVRRAGQGAV